MSTNPEPLDPDNTVATMSLGEVLAFLQGLRQATFQDINRSYSRLMAIGLFEHGYSDADRDKALGIADTVKVQILKTLAGHPDLIEEFERAAAMQIAEAGHSGIGSAEWMAEERRLSGTPRNA
jgi:hypothetical protein